MKFKKNMEDIKNKKEAKRKKALGELGELLAIKSLVDNEFTNIKNLNDINRVYPFADLYAEDKNGKKIVISVKARNQFQKNGLENLSYNLGRSVYINAKKVEVKFNAEAYWMAIAFNEKSFSIYFGSLTELNGKFCIPISKCKTGEIGENSKSFPKDKMHYFDWEFFLNEKL